MKTRTLPVLALLCALAGTSCKKDKPVLLDGEWLFPIAKGSFSLNSLSMFRHAGQHVELHAASLGLPEGTAVSSPGLYFEHLGPAEIPIADCIARIDIDTLSFSGTLTNNFPVTIAAGTRLVMRSSADTTTIDNIAGEATISQDLAPGTSFSFDVLVQNKTLGDRVYVYLEALRTPAFSKMVFSSNPTTLDISIDIVNASYAELFTGRECRSDDTTEFSAGSNDQGTQGAVSDTAISGTISVFADNSLPASAHMQLYFLGADKRQVLDSLFGDGPFAIGSGHTKPAGAPDLTFSDVAKVPVSHKKLERIRQASFVANRLVLNTSGQAGGTVSLNRDATLRLQLTGDLRLNIRF